METEKKRWVAAKKLSRASPSLCYVMACPEVAGGYFGHVLAFSKNSPAQLARRHVWSLPLHRKSPAPRSPPPPPLTPAATPRPREAGHLLVAPARPLRYVSPLPPFSPRSRYTGPAMVVAVPPLRRSFGYKAPEPIPTTFPGEHAFLPPRPLSCRSSILYRLTVRPKQCPTDLDDQSRGTRTNKKAWITCMVVYS